MIKEISLVHFRGHNRTVVFGKGTNTIAGPNESGKSTIKEAVAFVWCGTDAAGNSPDHLISKGMDTGEVTLVTEHASITRRKKRGQTSLIKITRHGFPPVSMNQTELKQVLKLSEDAFISAWQVGYFMALSEAKQLGVLGELAAIDRKELLKSLLPPTCDISSNILAKIKFVSPRIDADTVATERRQVQNVLASDRGILQQIAAQKQQFATAGREAVDEDSYSKRLNELNAQLAAHDFYQKALSKYQTEKMRWGEAMNRKGACEVGLMALRIPAPEEFDILSSELARLKTRLDGVDHALQVLHKKKKPAPAAPKKPVLVEGVRQCDKCSQPVTDEQFKRVMAAYEKELLEYNKEAREIANFNDKVETAIKKGQDEWGSLTYEIYNLESNKKQLAATEESMKKRKAELEKELAEVNAITEPLAPEKPAGDEVALRKEQLEVNTALDIHRRQKDQAELLDTQHRQYSASIAQKEKQISELTTLEGALKKLPQVETQKILETLKIDGIEVELNAGKLLITSESIPYTSLSSGRKMKSGIEFCKSLQKAAGSRAPTWLFVDDADLMDRYRELLPEDIQVFAAKVDGKLKELTVI